MQRVTVTRGTSLWRHLPATLFVVAGVSLVAVGWRSLAAERALAEGTCRRQLEATVASAAAQLKTVAAEAIGVAMGPAPGAVVDASGHFLHPAEPLTRGRLEPPATGEASARLQLAEAAKLEAQGDAAQARKRYLSVAQEGHEPLCRAVALHRLSCLERREGNEEAANTLLETLLATLPPANRDTWEVLFARAARANSGDAALRDDLLLALDTADEPIALELLRDSKIADDAAIAARRAALQLMRSIRGLRPDTAAQPSGARCIDSIIIAWWTAADGTTHFAEQPRPVLPAGVALVETNSIPTSDDLLIASAPLDMGMLSVLATQPMSEVDALASRSRWQFAGVFALLILGGGASVWLMQRATKREADAAHARSQFIARIGHDVRTPLALIRMYAETLASGKVSDPVQAREFAAIAARESERLTRMVQKVLDFSRTFERVPMQSLDLVALAQDVLAAHRPAFEQLGLALALSSHGEATHVMGDADALRDLLGNLLENALHYAASGRTVDVSVAGNGRGVELQVLDRGPGLPAAVREHLFERFVRGPEERHAGTGLGLALVREIAEAHGGTVAAAVRDGGGAVITVTLPHAEDA